MTSDISGVLLDSDYIIALFIDSESTHSVAKKICRVLGDTPQFILRPITYELATVISRKFGHAFAHAILDDIQQSLRMLNIHDFEEEIWKEFRAHKRKNISFFDCANLVAAQHYRLKIASFDQFYPRNIRIS